MYGPLNIISCKSEASESYNISYFCNISRRNSCNKVKNELLLKQVGKLENTTQVKTLFLSGNFPFFLKIISQRYTVVMVDKKMLKLLHFSILFYFSPRRLQKKK